MPISFLHREVPRPGPRPAVLPASETAAAEVEKLRRVVVKTAPLGGLVSGVPRLKLGIARVQNARTVPQMIHGISTMATAGLSFLYGAVSASGSLATAAGIAHLATFDAALTGAAMALGGFATAGYAGGGSAILKGLTDMALGAKAHNSETVILGTAKVGLGALMITGAVTATHVLVGLGGGACLLVALIGNRKAVAHGAVSLAHMLSRKMHQDKPIEADPT